MLKVKNLKIEYRKKLFENLSFTLGNKEKVGLIGLNGCGKSTLLKILARIETPDAGSIECINESIAYLPQEYTFEKGLLVGEVLESLVEDHLTEMYKINKVLNKLEFSDVDHYQEVSTLSYGQKMKLYFVKVLINNPTILLLDEPTNHLDIYGILWLENFIKSFEGICIIVSHDRAFLNSVIDKVFEIDEQRLNIFIGNYDDYLEQKDDLIAKRRTQFILQERKREKFENMIERIKKFAPGESQSRALKAAKHRMEREVNRNEVNKYKEQRIKNLALKGRTHSSKLVLKIEDLDFSYSETKPLLESAKLVIYGKEKVWFYGENGIGKSTLIKLIAGDLLPQKGKLKLGDNLRVTYFSQDQSHLDPEKTVEEHFLSNTDISYSKSFGILQQFLFDKEMRTMKISRLSPGQRARLTFAVFSQKEYDFMILDEPTNHLDIKSKEVIEQALREFEGTLLLISHDRYFVESIGINRSITIRDKQIVEI